MKITFRHILALIAILTITLIMGYLIDDLFNRQWYGYIFIGMALSFTAYAISVPKTPNPFPHMHPYLKVFLVFSMSLVICLTVAFLAQRLFGLNFYRELVMASVFTNVMAYNSYKTKIKKQ